MKVSKFRAGNYIITLHNHSFSLEKMSEDKYWTLYNASGTEINRCETKSGLIQVMKRWSPEYAKQEAQQTFCTYA
jgi:hypothetical protein